jgi:hypothetical protein
MAWCSGIWNFRSSLASPVALLCSMTLPVQRATGLWFTYCRKPAWAIGHAIDFQPASCESTSATRAVTGPSRAPRVRALSALISSRVRSMLI